MKLKLILLVSKVLQFLYAEIVAFIIENSLDFVGDRRGYENIPLISLLRVVDDVHDTYRIKM